MPIQKTDRDTILQAAVHCFKTRGFHQTSMADLGEATGLLKGSLYHYFKNKDELAIEAVKWVEEWFERKVFAPLLDSHGSIEKAWIQAWEATLVYFTEREGGCLPGNLTLEVGLSHPVLLKACQRYFSNWEKALAKGLERKKISKRESMARAKSMVAEVQGLLLLERLQGKGLLKKRIAEWKKS
ncbi:MAG: TetR/AcrR family transcriptional regulator [Verrucomicrobiota bacterium]